jgi:predicted alpha/beta-fold hydrolase
MNMPVLETCSYKPPVWLPGGHAQTIGPRLFSRSPRCVYRREYLELEDGDFFSLDWLLAHKGGKRLASRLVILSHGLEGDSRSLYMKSLAGTMVAAGWDVAARNCRSCGEMNRLPRLYHSGETDDLHAVVRLCVERGYRHIALAGFSMGGNQTLMYLGRETERVPKEVRSAAAVSAPCDLSSSGRALARPGNRLYMACVMRTLRKQMRAKHHEFPELFDIRGLSGIKTFKEFDDRFTAPIHGFTDARDYWEKASSKPYLPAIAVPTLLVNAKNDPFLGPECFPVDEAAANPLFHLMMPAGGGHVGFPDSPGAPGWLNRTILSFLSLHGGDDAPPADGIREPA